MTVAALPPVLVVTPDFPPADGGIQLTAQRVTSLLRGLAPTVVTLSQPAASAYDERQPFAIHRSRPLAVRPATVLGLNAEAVAIGLRGRTAAVLSMHIVGSPAGAVLSRRLGIPFVQYLHGHELGVRPRLARLAVRAADRVVAVSSYTAERAEAIGADRDRIAIVHPGVDLPSLRPPQDRRGPPTVVTIARLEERYKGHDVILRALPLVRSKVPDVRWRVIGDGALRPMLQERCRTMGLGGTVRFLGPVSDAERDAELERADVFCMVSRMSAGSVAGEGFGIVYLEAGAHSLPVVAGAVGGATDAVVHDQTGLLVDPEDHLAVAEALVTLLTDRDRARRLGDGGRARAEACSWQSTADQVGDLLLGLMS